MRVEAALIQIIFLIAVLVFVLPSPEPLWGKEGPYEDNAVYCAEILKWRADKDAFFRTSPSSPIPAQERRGFSGLEYYPISEEYRVKAVFDKYFWPRSRVPASEETGEGMEAVGKMKFKLKGIEQVMEVWRDRASKRLMVLFMDPTNGESTYGVGRYLDVTDLDRKRAILDFNYAYNPYCHYNPAFSCPMPPRQNRLSIPIEAGEMVLKNH